MTPPLHTAKLVARPEDLPRVNNRVNTENLHPELVARAVALCADVPGLQVVSGCRAKGQPSRPGVPAPLNSQWYFWERYQAGRGNMAADPEKVSASGWHGSRHMVQPDGYGHAIDWAKPARTPWAEVHRAAEAHGLAFPLASRERYGRWAEDWHCVGETVRGTWIPRESGQKIDLSGLTVTPRCSDPVLIRHMQARLRLHGARLGLTGRMDRATRHQLRAFQRRERLTVDGICGPQTWTALTRNPT